MSDTEVTFARVRLAGRTDEIVLGEAASSQIVYVGGALALHIPDHLDPAVLTALSKVFAEAALRQSTRRTIKAVAA